jgi:hypothetical protein
VRRQRKVIPVVDVVVFSGVVDLGDVDLSGGTDHVERLGVGVSTTGRLHLLAARGERHRG